MATVGDPVLGSWAARCRKAPGTLVLTAETAGARLVHVANDGPRTEIELSEGVELEVTKPRASALALARLSNLSEHLGSRLVIEFVEDFTENPNQKWSNLREFSELMHGLLAKKPAKEAEKASASVPENSTVMWVLKSSLDELLKAERLTETQSSKAAESTQIAAAMALLQHIWSSKYTETDLRSRLCQEAQKLLSLLENRLVKSAQGSPGDADAVARALLPCLRRAVALEIKIEQMPWQLCISDNMAPTNLGLVGEP
eukprot:Skav212022  [mRNA]  locus=scaffold984:159031:161593:+ [translate_table: standard]